MPKFVNHIDLDYNQLIRGTFHKVTTDPATPVAGQLVYNTTNNVVRLRRASTWEVMWVGQMLSNGGGITIGSPDANTGVVQLSLKYDDTTINLNVSDQLQIKAITQGLIPLTAGKILIGAQTTNVAGEQTVSGDVSIGLTGVTAIGTNKVVYSMLQQSSATGYAIMAKTTTGAGNYAELNASANDRVLARTSNAIGFVQITNAMIADGTLTPGKIALAVNQVFVGNASGFATGVAMSGDVAIVAAGTTTIQANVVTYGKIQQCTTSGYAIMAKVGTGAGNYAEVNATTTNRVFGRTTGDLAFIQIDNNHVATSAAIAWSKLASTVTFANAVAGKTGGTGALTSLRMWISTDTITYDNTTLMSSLAIKGYVDQQAGGAIGTLVGGWDANTETVFPGSGATIKGDYWYVTADGTIQGVQFRTGDVIIAKQDNPTNTNAAHYIFLEKNIDIATETAYGTLELATQTEVNNATAGALAVTPSTLDGWHDNFKVPYTANETLATNGVLTTVTFTHNLGTQTNITATVIEISTNDIVYPDIKFNSTTQCQVSFATAPAASTYRIFVTAYS